MFLRLDTDPDPEIRRPLKLLGDPPQTVGPLREYLEHMPVGLTYDREDAIDEEQRHGLMEEIAHGVDEDVSRLAPRERLVHHIRLQRDLETIAVARLAHGMKPQRHPLCITMFAPGADLGATGHWIPGRIGPFDARLLSHSVS